MSERLTRAITPPPDSEVPLMQRLGCTFEETDEGMIVTYPEGATRETVDEREGRYTVFITHKRQQRQITELYNRFTGRYIIVLRPFPLY
jgi:hypothetical protein